MDLRGMAHSRARNFTGLMTEAAVRLPLKRDPDHFGVIMDADGKDVVTVDVNGERPNEEVARIMAAIIVAVNGAGSRSDREAS